MSGASGRAAARTSIVIAAHDAAATLAQTLDSLLAQSDADWQALVVDDGSRDDTPRLIADYAARDARIVGLRTTEDGSCRGASAARNRGLAAAQGERLLFLDSDDWIAPNHLQMLNAALGAPGGAVAAYCNHHRVMADGATAPARSDALIAVAPMDVFARSCGVAIHAVVVERVLVQRAGGFDETLRTCEDWDLWQRVARLGGRWVHVDAALAFYRASEHSLSRDIERMVVDAAIVIERGHGRDVRLDGQVLAHPDGAAVHDGKRAATARAYFALWCAAFDCGRGHDGAAMRTHLAELPQGADHTRAIVDTLFDGAMVGLRAAPQRLAACWSAFGLRVAALIGAVTASAGDARRVQYAFERLVLQYDDLAQPRPLMLTLGQRVDLRRPVAVAPPRGIDRLYVYLCDGSRVLAVREFGVLGVVTVRQYMEIAAAIVGRPQVRALSGRAVARAAWPRRIVPALAACALALRHRGRAAEMAWQALLAAAGPARPPGSHGAVLHGLHQAHAAPALPSTPLPRAWDAMHPPSSEAAHARIPVLAYRRVRADALDAHLGWLAHGGYRTIVSAELVDVLASKAQSTARLVLITFDHADRHFADVAWPLLRRHAMRAELFISSTLSDDMAAGPSRDGDRGTLRIPPEIGGLAGDGVRLGVRLPGDGDTDGLSTHALAEALVRARAGLARWTGQVPHALALSSGKADSRLRRLARECGYGAVFGTESGPGAVAADEAMDFGRASIADDMGLEDFAACMKEFQ